MLSGSFLEEVERALTEGLSQKRHHNSRLLRRSEQIEEMVAPYLGDDPVFGRMNGLMLEDFFDPNLLRWRATTPHSGNRTHARHRHRRCARMSDPRILVYADLARWEIQRRQRRGEIGNLGADNLQESASLKYKRAFFIDWRAADRLKKRLLPVSISCSTPTTRICQR